MSETVLVNEQTVLFDFVEQRVFAVRHRAVVSEVFDDPQPLTEAIELDAFASTPRHLAYESARTADLSAAELQRRRHATFRKRRDPGSPSH